MGSAEGGCNLRILNYASYGRRVSWKYSHVSWAQQTTPAYLLLSNIVHFSYVILVNAHRVILPDSKGIEFESKHSSLVP